MGIERTAAVRELRLRVPEADLESLYRRLRTFRASGDYIAAGLDRIVPAAYADDLLDYWVDGYDWRAHERRLSAYDHYSTEISGQVVHFLHLRSARPDARPALLTHAYSPIFCFLTGISAALVARYQAIEGAQEEDEAEVEYA